MVQTLLTAQLCLGILTPANIYTFKANNGNTRKMFKTCSRFNNKKYQNDVNEVVLMFLLLTLNIFHTFS